VGQRAASFSAIISNLWDDERWHY
jgi:hypothetical protein